MDFLVLGYGLTAQYLKKKISEEFPDKSFVSTSRSNSDHLIFNLENPDTWESLPRAKNLIWTFPPAPFKAVQSFFNSQKDNYENWVVVGSTSAFHVQTSDQIVNENSPLDESIERVKSEKFLLDQGCRLVFSSGIYSVERNPLDWIRSGRVGKNSKFVNMVHVEDLCEFIVNSIEHGKPGEVYIASDNKPQKWIDVIEVWERAGLLKDIDSKESQRISKKVDSSKSIKNLQVHLKHPDFSQSVLQMSQPGLRLDS